MFRNSQQNCRRRTAHIISTRSFVLTKCRCKKPNLNSRNYYDLLGVERTATQKEIRKAFVKLSKEYHPDSNANDKSLHDKFVKINEAFSILSKQSTRITYDQTLDSTSTSYSRPSPPRQPTPSSPFDWTYANFDNRRTYRQRPDINETDWGTPHFDKTFFDMLRRRMEQDRRQARQSSYNRPPPPFGLINTYIAPFSIISFLIGFGVLIHALQWRIEKFSDPNFATDPRSRSYHAYREWQRLSSLKNAESIPMRDSSIRRDEN